MSEISEPAISRILGLFIRRKTTFVATQRPHPSENGFCHLKDQLKHQARVVPRNRLFVILFSAVRKLQKLSILLITNYSSVYLSIYLFYQSIYLIILLEVGVSYQRVPCLPENYSYSWEIHFKWERFYLIGGDQANNQSKKSLPIVVG